MAPAYKFRVNFILKNFQKILILIFVQLFCLVHNRVAQDSIPALKVSKHAFNPDPVKATMMAVVFPGLGQVYNRKYVKVPVVYAGFGVLFYFSGINSSNYVKYMKAYQDFTDNIPGTKSYQVFERLKNIDPATAEPSEVSNIKDQLVRGIDYYKRYRDLSYIGIGAWYLISILDANVDASLFNYDITNNLDIALLPMQISLPGGFTGAGVNMSIKITF